MNAETKLALAMCGVFVVGACMIAHGLGWITKPAFLFVGIALCLGTSSVLAALFRR